MSRNYFCWQLIISNDQLRSQIYNFLQFLCKELFKKTIRLISFAVFSILNSIRLVLHGSQSKVIFVYSILGVNGAHHLSAVFSALF